MLLLVTVFALIVFLSFPWGSNPGLVASDCNSTFQPTSSGFACFNVFIKLANPASFFVYFRSFQTQTYGKTVGFSWVRPCIVGVEGKLADHLTTLFNAFYVKRVTLVYGCIFYLFFVSQLTFILNISLSLCAI